MNNETAKIAVKVNGQLTKRVPVKDVEIQGSVWGSIKCTTTMDQLNKILLQQEQLIYSYKGDQNIKIGVLGVHFEMWKHISPKKLHFKLIYRDPEVYTFRGNKCCTPCGEKL